MFESREDKTTKQNYEPYSSKVPLDSWFLVISDMPACKRNIGEWKNLFADGVVKPGTVLYLPQDGTERYKHVEEPKYLLHEVFVHGVSTELDKQVTQIEFDNQYRVMAHDIPEHCCSFKECADLRELCDSTNSKMSQTEKHMRVKYAILMITGVVLITIAAIASAFALSPETQPKQPVELCICLITAAALAIYMSACTLFFERKHKAVMKQVRDTFAVNAQAAIEQIMNNYTSRGGNII